MNDRFSGWAVRMAAFGSRMERSELDFGSLSFERDVTNEFETCLLDPWDAELLPELWTAPPLELWMLLPELWELPPELALLPELWLLEELAEELEPPEE